MKKNEYEEKIIIKIGEVLEKLETTLSDMADTESKTHYFVEQEKAILEIKKVIREERKLEKLEEKELEAELSLVDGIVNHINHLDKKLAELGEDPNHVKAFVIQRECIRDIKKIIRDVTK